MKDRVVIVTGAAGVLGQAVATEFAARGARVAPVDIVPAPAHANSYTCDLNNADACRSTVEAIRGAFGRIDALINVAGGFTMGEQVHETSAATFEGMLDINARTLLNITRVVVPVMLAAGHGAIVNIAARAGLRGSARMGAYSASKSVVLRLTEALADELKNHGINVNCVMPSIIDTPRNRADMPDADPTRWVKPADLAKVITFLASEDARAIHGAAIPVDGLS
jgi:NAD(P)-dependent dehydrogenase (short-subunit alcohol dehydrogenase family)